MKNFIVVILLIFCVSSTAWSQNTPTPAQTLRLARATYEQGRLHEIPTQLNDDVISKMNKQEKVEAYKILCLSYIYLEEPEKADESMLNILRTDPYFEINPAVDPAEFVSLYNTFRTTPIYRLGATLGVNATRPNVSDVLNTTGGSAKYTYKIGLQFGASGEIPINELFTVRADLLYQTNKFELTTSKDQGDGDLNEALATETQTRISLPIMLQYNVIKSKFNPYVALGASVDLLLNSSLSAERLREGETSVEPKNFDVKDQRNKLNVSGVAALGAKYKIAGGFLIAEARYIYGFSKVTNEKTVYDNQDIYLAYGLPNAIYKINSVSFAFTYVQNKFKPKKLRRK